jgi:glycosyltransferase involved in cell wall biosynthesis
VPPDPAYGLSQGCSRSEFRAALSDQQGLKRQVRPGVVHNWPNGWVSGAAAAAEPAARRGLCDPTALRESSEPAASGGERGGTRSVLHVLPHPGGGGETYIDALSEMDGYRFNRVYLAQANRPSPSILRTMVRAQRAAPTYDVLHVHGEVAGAICLPALARRASVVTLHGLHLLRRLEGPARLAARANLWLIVRAASRTICVANAERFDVVEAVGAHAARRVVVIHNGIDLPRPPTVQERRDARAELRISPSTTVGAYVGSLDARKDPSTAVRAALDVARSNTELLLLVAGDGPLRAELENVARGSDSVRLLGHQPDVRRVLAAADFFVLPSRREGLSYAVLEAMSMSLPTVVSDAPGNPEAVGDAGIVVSRGDTDGFAAAYIQLLTDAKLRLSLGERARLRVATEFLRREMVQRTRAVYDGIV